MHLHAKPSLINNFSLKMTLLYTPSVIFHNIEEVKNKTMERLKDERIKLKAEKSFD